MLMHVYLPVKPLHHGKAFLACGCGRADVFHVKHVVVQCAHCSTCLFLIDTWRQHIQRALAQSLFVERHGEQRVPAWI